MITKPVRLRQQASLDAERFVDYHRQEAGQKIALTFVSAQDQTFGQIGRHPGSGSSRYGQELQLPGLRFLLLKGFPVLAFYVQQVDHVEVWRLLHEQRDIPAWFHDFE